jgi:hypothetical protein
MTTINVYKPTVAEWTSGAFDLAPRGGDAPDGGYHLTIVENSKPRAKWLLTRVAELARERLPIAEIEVHSKLSAGKELDADVTRMLAARSHLVITGLGD